MKWGVLVALFVAWSWSTSLARADRRNAEPPPPPPATARLTPWPQPTPPIGEARYFYVLEVSAGSDPNVEVVLDRRLLHFEFRDEARRRTIRCDHPNAPSAQRAMRAASHLTDNGTPASYREWIDLRSYCFGSALTALDRGAHLVASYGWKRGGRNVWVARAGDNRARLLDAGALDVAPLPTTTPTTTPTTPVVVRVAPVDRANASGMVLNVSVSAREGRRRVYVRPDLFQFRIRGPLGSVSCAVPTLPIVPIADFFSTITERSAASRSLDAQRFCPDAFPVEGIYEITPIVDLPYTPRGARPANDVVTGHFEGPASVIRIRAGSRGYVDQDPNDGRPRATHAHEETP